MSFKIPLSYNPIPTEALANVLEQYKDKHHQTIINDFETEICKNTGSPFAVALNSGTSAIHLGLKLLGVGKGDLVICPTFTYVASVNPVLYLGAEPVFVDCEMQTWCMDPALLEAALVDLEKLGKRPKAIVVVYAYGMPGRIDELIAIGKKFKVPILEDAAEALGSTSRSRHMGTIGDVGIISFNNNKIVTTYGGGVLLVKTRELYDKALFWATQSREDKPYYEHKEVGFNYRMGPLNAAVGLSQLSTLQQIVKARREQYSYYKGKLNGKCTFRVEMEDDFSNQWLTTCLIKDLEIIELVKEFSKLGIEIRAVWCPMHRQPLFSEMMQYLNGNADLVFNHGISLPSTGAQEDLSTLIDHLFKSSK